MRKTADLTTIKLSSLFTDGIILYDDSDIESIYAESVNGTEILRRGKNAIPDIGKYLNSNELNEKLLAHDEETVRKIKEGWIMLYVDVAFEGTRPPILTDFEKLREMSLRYVPRE